MSKIAAPFILSLVIILCSGCGKSMKDVAGVYGTKEIRTTSPQDSAYMQVSQWFLDLSDSGKYSLKESVYLHPRHKETRKIHKDGFELLGAEWTFSNNGKVFLKHADFSDGEGGLFGRIIESRIILNPENNGDLVVTDVVNVTDDQTLQNVATYSLIGTRFARIK